MAMSSTPKNSRPPGAGDGGDCRAALGRLYEPPPGRGPGLGSHRPLFGTPKVYTTTGFGPRKNREILQNFQENKLPNMVFDMVFSA